MKIRISEQELKIHGCPNCIWRLHDQCPHNITEGKSFTHSQSQKLDNSQSQKLDNSQSQKLDNSQSNGKFANTSLPKDKESGNDLSINPLTKSIDNSRSFPGSSKISSEDVQDDEFNIDGICNEYLKFIFSFAEEGDSTNNLWEKFSLHVARLQSLDDYKEFLKLRDEVNTRRQSMDIKEKITSDIQLNTLRLWWERLNDTVRKGYGHIADREAKEKEGTKLPGIMSARTINFNIGNDEKKEIGSDKKELEDKRT